MAKFLKITNKGFLDPLGLMLMGASTKDNDASKIGKYGSGWKYALACLIRNEIYFEIWSEEWISVNTERVKLKNCNYDMIMINEQPSNITTSLGPDWKVWMAIREIFCNAIDEGDYTLAVIPAEKKQEIIENHTRKQTEQTLIFIKINEEIEDIISTWQEYFSFDRTDDVFATPGVKVYKKLYRDRSIIYRKGIKVGESRKAGCFDYDFENIPINEIRELLDFDHVVEALKSFMKFETNSEILKTIMETEDTWEKDIRFYIWESIGKKAEWRKAIGKRAIVPKEFVGKLTNKETPSETILQVDSNMAQLINIELSEVTVLGYVGSKIMIPVVSYSDELKVLTIAAGNFIEKVIPEFSEIIQIVDFNNSYSEGSFDSEYIYLSVAAESWTYEQIIRVILKQFYLKRYKLSSSSIDFENFLLDELMKTFSVIVAVQESRN